MRFLILLISGTLPFLLGSCSSSRLQRSDRILTAGEHRVRTVTNCDILIPAGSTLQTDYISGNRIFVQTGGTLTGLSKGAKNSTIYAEPGALLPPAKRRSFVHLVKVDDAEASYEDRFQNLLPAGVRGTNGSHLRGAGYLGGGSYLGSGFYGRRFYRGRRGFGRFGRSGRSSFRATSVQPRSYRARR